METMKVLITDRSRIAAALRLAGTITIIGSVSVARSDEVLFTFNHNFDANRALVTDAKATKVGTSTGTHLRVDTGHKESSPGITLKAPTGHWNLSQFANVTVALRNCGTNSVIIHCRVDNPGADGSDHCVTASLSIVAGKATTLTV